MGQVTFDYYMGSIGEVYQPRKTQTSLLIYNDKLEYWNFAWGKFD